MADGITRGTMSRQVKLVQSQRKDQNQKIWNIQGRKSIVSMKFLIFSGKKFPIFFREKISISDKYNFGVFSETRFPIFFREKSSDIYSEKISWFLPEKKFPIFFLFFGKKFQFFSKKSSRFFCGKKFRYHINTIPNFFRKKSLWSFFAKVPDFLWKKLSDLFREKNFDFR